MSQCVPSWNLDNDPTHPKLTFCPRSNLSNSFAADVPSLDYGVSELAWENGQLAMYGLGPPRPLNKPAAWEKPRATDTLESVVDQATANPHAKSVGGNKLVPWLDHRQPLVKPAAAASNVDALVPCNNSSIRSRDNSAHVSGIGTCMVGSCSGGGCLARAGPGCGKSYASAGESATCGGGDSLQVTLDSCDREFGGGGLTSTSLWSPENTSSGEDYTKTSTEDHDSVFRSRSQRQAGDKGNKKRSGKSSILAKSRAAAVHNQSERRRRDKINQRMKTLQKLVPNSSKTDKASMLDEVIEYLKQLQAQVHMMGMSRMNMPSMNMMMPLPMQQQLQMSMMGMGMGMGVMDMNAMGRVAGMPPMMPSPSAAAPAFMHMPSWDMHAGDRLQFPQITPDFLSTFMACQPQPMTMDAYSRMAALYQQSLAGSGSKN